MLILVIGLVADVLDCPRRLRSVRPTARSETAPDGKAPAADEVEEAGMVEHQTLIELERAGWQALSSSPEAAARHYESVLADDVLMLLPGGTVIEDRDRVVDSMRGPSWDGFQITDERVLRVDPDCAVVAYQAVASRGDVCYRALFNSTYARRNGEWKLVLHQQTPI
jgi:hypothetical protein